VYRIAGTPISATHSQRFQPKIAENTTAGAAMIVLADMPRDRRKRSAVNVLVFASKRRSRNSYAVNTLAPCRNGTSVTPRMTIASGSPK
jgi:hypothetical protein